MSPGAGVTADPTLPGTRVVLVPVAAEHVPTRFAVLVEGAVRGMVQYSEGDEPDYRHASIDIFLDPAIHGRGVGRDTVATLARYLTHDRGHHRL
jgi:RimJ/RimL family protein N-acetyltransferase